MQRIKSITRLSALLMLAFISLSGCSRLGEPIAQMLPANEDPLIITSAVSKTSNSDAAVVVSNQSSPSVVGTAAALKPEGFIQVDIDSEYGEMMVVGDLEEEMDFLDMAEYVAEIDKLNSMAAEEEVYGGDRGITPLVFGEDFEMMIRDMPKEDPIIAERVELKRSPAIIEEYMAYYGYRGETMQQLESRTPSQRARKAAQQKTYPNIRDYLKNRSN